MYKRQVKEINPDLVYLRGSDDPDVAVGAVSLLGKFPIDVYKRQLLLVLIACSFPILKKIKIYFMRK